MAQTAPVASLTPWPRTVSLPAAAGSRRANVTVTPGRAWPSSVLTNARSDVVDPLASSF